MTEGLDLKATVGSSTDWGTKMPHFLPLIHICGTIATKVHGEAKEQDEKTKNVLPYWWKIPACWGRSTIGHRRLQLHLMPKGLKRMCGDHDVYVLIRPPGADHQDTV